MRTAIVGLGNIGATVARNLVAGGREVIVADRDAARGQALAAELGAGARAAAVEAALGAADVVVLAVPLDVLRELVASHHAALAGKIVVDPSNPIVPDGAGGFGRTLPEGRSSGVVVAGLLPEGAELVKAFGTLGADSLRTAARRAPERAALFYAADRPEAGRVVAALIEASGFAPVPVGGVDQSLRIEVGGDLHEFGGAGRPLSRAEAEALVRAGAA